MDCDEAVVQSVVLEQLSRPRVRSVLEAAYGGLGCSESGGNEARRFKITVPCRGADGGNEADGGNSEAGRVKQVMDRRSDFGGGVGGVDIHVGGEDLVKSELYCEEPWGDKG